ncbi:hypothetical protein PROFUN_16508, partial [Planoprotostelium fungivorum]
MSISTQYNNKTFIISEKSATKKHIQCMFIEKEHLGFLWFEIILYKQRLIELFGSYVPFEELEHPKKRVKTMVEQLVQIYNDKDEGMQMSHIRVSMALILYLLAMAEVYPIDNVQLGTKLQCNHQSRQCHDARLTFGAQNHPLCSLRSNEKIIRRCLDIPQTSLEKPQLQRELTAEGRFCSGHLSIFMGRPRNALPPRGQRGHLRYRGAMNFSEGQSFHKTDPESEAATSAAKLCGKILEQFKYEQTAGGGDKKPTVNLTEYITIVQFVLFTLDHFLATPPKKRSK